MDYAGEFEVHLTVQATTENVVDFRHWCTERDLKCVHIVLSRGAVAQQPMATWRRADTTLPIVHAEAEQIAADVQRAGFIVNRLKIEAAPTNVGVPADDHTAQQLDPANYFEHHIKLRRASEDALHAVHELCEKSGAHLSRNAFRQLQDGMEERFVTARGYGIGRQRFTDDLQQLLSQLRQLGEQIVEYESEYCVFDSNVELDAGWLPAKPERAES